MAIKASEIRDEESLREWLEEGYASAEYVIATRAALRVFPLALSHNFINHSALNVNLSLNLNLAAFQASYISWISLIYPNLDVKVSSIMAINAVSAAIDNVGKVSADFSIVNLAARAASYAAANTTGSAIEAATYIAHAFSIFTDVTITFAAVRADAEWLEKHPDDIDGLINQPLWLEPDDEPEGYRFLQSTFKDEFDKFRQSDLARETSFGLICDWYAALLPEKGKPRSLFGEKKDLELATQPKEFWEGEAQEVMDRVAELVGWPEDYRKQEDNKTDKDEQAKSEKFSKAKAEKVSSNRTSIRLQLTAILNSVATEFENIGNQPNDEEKQNDWVKKKEFLDEISELANKALNLLPIEPDGTQNEKDDEVASLLSEYAQEFENWLRKNKPEVVDSVMRLGSAAGFTSVFYLVGGYMPIATPMIFVGTFGDKAIKVMQILKSSLPKKKPKDKDE